MLRVTGRVHVMETGEGLPGLHVKVVDKDLFFDDVLGTAVSDADGRFEITYDKKDFSELFEKAPDLYVVVRDPTSGRVLASSEDSVRCDAGVDEQIDVPISQSVIDAASGAGPDPYGPESGTVKVSLVAPRLPAAVTLLFTEHRAHSRGQHRFVVEAADEVAVDLPSGEYTMQILVPGFETVRGLAEVDPSRPFAVDAALEPREPRIETFEERLAKYGIEPKESEIGDLAVPAEATLALTLPENGEQRGFTMLHSDSIAQHKAWIGSDDARFGHDRPVFGPLPDENRLARLLKDGADLGALDPVDLKAVTAVAREYVQGNSKAVAHYEPLLDNVLKAKVSKGMSKFPVHFYRVVTIDPGGTLEVGEGSAIFVCDELRVHTTGTLQPVAGVSIDIGTYTEYT